MLGKFSTIISSKISSYPFFFLSFFWDPYYLNVGVFDIVPEVSETILSSFILFTLFCSSEVISTILSSSSLIHSCASDILLFIPSKGFLISVVVLLISACLFFYYSRSFHFIHFASKFLIIFTIIILNSFSGNLPISSSFI